MNQSNRPRKVLAGELGRGLTYVSALRKAGLPRTADGLVAANFINQRRFTVNPYLGYVPKGAR